MLRLPASHGAAVRKAAAMHVRRSSKGEAGQLRKLMKVMKILGYR